MTIATEKRTQTVPLYQKRLQMPEMMRKLADKSLTIAKTTHATRDALRVSQGETVRALSSGLALAAKTHNESLIRTTQVAVLTASSWIDADPFVGRCVALAPGALKATAKDAFSESLYKSVVPYKTQGATDDTFTLWAPEEGMIDPLFSQARDCGLPLKWFVQIYVCGVLSEYGDIVLDRFAALLKSEYEYGRRWVKYRAEHVLAVAIEESEVL